LQLHPPDPTQPISPKPLTQTSLLAPGLNPRQTVRRWRDRFFAKRSIGTKVIWGYGISLGIAVLGTSTGLLIGNHYQQQAKQQQQQAYHRVSLLSQLQVTMSHFRPEREFLPVLSDPSRFETAHDDYHQRLEQVETLLTAIQTTLTAKDTATVEAFLSAFEREVQRYSDELASILHDIDPQAIDAATVRQIENQVADFTSGSVYLRLVRYSDELTSFVNQAEANSEEANRELVRAANLSVSIIFGSMLLSIVIAGLLSWEISRAISSPIKEVTAIAKQVTEQDDFSLRTPVKTQDEVGILAASLNELIQRVANYTTELKEAQTQLIQNEKMSSLGQMVAGIAHEINNPVNFIYGNLNHAREYADDLLGLIQLYQDEYPNPPESIELASGEMELEFVQEDLPKLIDSMKVGANRIREIVLSLRNFSRLDEAEMKAVDLHEGIDSTLLLLNNRLKQGIDIVKNYGDLPKVVCYPAQVNQVFMNIISNATDALLSDDAISDKTITISTETISSQVIVKIQDNGPGIPEKIKGRLFDPFFTTKPIGKGTGLGLAITKRLIEGMDGTILVISEEGQGLIFTVELPRAKIPTLAEEKEKPVEVEYASSSR